MFCESCGKPALRYTYYPVQTGSGAKAHIRICAACFEGLERITVMEVRSDDGRLVTVTRRFQWKS
jgi:hypothetical protein